MKGDAGRRAPRPALLLLVVLTVVAAVYAPSLGGEFVWDDHIVVLGSPEVTRLQPLPSYWGRPFWSESELSPETRAFYRPLTTLSYAVDYRLHGPNPAGFRLTNLALHLLNTTLLFVLLRRHASGILAALLAACWALLPRSTEVAAWISGRPDALAATGVLAALCLWSESLRSRLLASLALLGGLLAKEVALAGGAFIVALELSSAPGRGLGARLLRLAPLGAALGVYAALRISVFSGGEGDITELGPAERALAVLEAVGRYAFMLLDPWRPRAQLGLLGAPSMPWVLAGGAVGVLGVLVLVRHRLSLRRVAGPLALSAAGLALVLHFIPAPIKVVAADRYLYVPAIGLALVAGSLDLGAVRGWRFPASLAVLALTLAPPTFSRALEWADEVAFWRTALRTTPDENPFPRLNWAGLHYRAGEAAQALEAYAAALDRLEAYYRRRSRHPDPRFRVELANCLVLTGNDAQAEQLLAGVTHELPTFPRARFALALARLRRLDFSGARRELDETLRLLPSHARARELRDKLPALEREALALKASGQGEADLARRARFLGGVGRVPQAIAEYAAVLALEQVPPAAASEAVEYIVRFGTPDQAARAAHEYVRVTGGELTGDVAMALAAKLDLARRLGRERSSVAR